MCYDDFDSGIKVIHTLIDMKNIKFSRSIEPEIIQIFDFNITSAEIDTEIRMLLRKDQEF